MTIAKDAEEKLEEGRDYERGEDQFFSSRRITEGFTVAFIILGVALFAACAWGALSGAFA